MTDPFLAISKVLLGYSKHYWVSTNSDELVSLDEELPHARTQFGFVQKTKKGGARMGFYPLHVFPELAATLPPSLAARVRSKSLLTFDTLSTDDHRKVSAMVRAGHHRIRAQRRLAPNQAYCRKIDLAATTALITKLANRPDVTVTPKQAELVVTLAPKMKVPPVLAARQKKPGALTFKTITPAEHDALAALIG